MMAQKGPEQQPGSQPEFVAPTEERWGLSIEDQIILFANPGKFETGSVIPRNILLRKVDLACQYLGSFWPADQLARFMDKYGNEANQSGLSVAAVAIKHDLHPSWPGSSTGSHDQAIAIAKYEASADMAARDRVTYIEELFAESERVFSQNPSSELARAVRFPAAPWPNDPGQYPRI